MAKIISIANQKGGVGKTTTVLTLGTCLSIRGYNTLLIDLDSSASLSVQLTYGIHNNKTNVYAMFRNGNLNWEDLIIKTEIMNLDLIQSHIDLTKIERDLVNSRKIRAFLLRKRLNSILEKYDYIILDTSPSFSSLLLNCLVASDLTIIPINTEFSVFHGVNIMMDTIKMVEDATKKKCDYRFLVTMYDDSVDSNRKSLNLIMEKFRGIVYNTVIEKDPNFMEANNNGKPITIFMPRSKGSMQYQNLLEEDGIVN